MKKIALLPFIVFIAVSAYGGDTPQRIILTGKIDNYEPNHNLALYIHRLGFSSYEKMLVSPDSAGNFITTFESYIPLDIWLRAENSPVTILLHPGDSLFVRFDGTLIDNRAEFLKTVVFSGDRAETNRYVTKFLRMYSQMFYSEEQLNAYWKKEQTAHRRYDADQYLRYADTILQMRRNFYEQFIIEHTPPNEESKTYLRLYIEGSFIQKLGWHPTYYRIYNNFSCGSEIYKWRLPQKYFDSFFKWLPIDSSMFVGADALSRLVGPGNLYLDYYRHRLLVRDPEFDFMNKDLDSAFVSQQNLKRNPPLNLTDDFYAFIIFGTIEFITDPLLRQFLLTAEFDREFRQSRAVTLYELFRDEIDTYITEPFLREPLHQRYLQTKWRIENPPTTESILKEAANLSVHQILDSIVQQNKSKVVYVNVWATWCGPCIGKMSELETISENLKNEDIAFVYICIESEEQNQKRILDRFNLTGQHYFLSKTQSTELRQLFGITGIPFSLLIDRNGVIIDQDICLLEMENRVRALLK